MSDYIGSAAAFLGNCRVTRDTDAVLRGSSVGPHDFGAGADLIVQMPNVLAAPTTVPAASLLGVLTTDEVVAIINATLDPVAQGYAVNRDGCVELHAVRQLADKYTTIYVSVDATSPAAEVLGFRPDIGVGVASAYSGELSATLFEGARSRNPDGSVFIGAESLSEETINRALSALATSQDYYASHQKGYAATLYSTYEAYVATSGAKGALPTGTQDVDFTDLQDMLTGISSDMFVGFSLEEIREFLRVVDSNGYPVYDASGSEITVQYVTSGTYVGPGDPAACVTIGDGGSLLKFGSTPTKATLGIAKAILDVPFKDHIEIASAYSVLASRHLLHIETSTTEPCNDGWWRVSGVSNSGTFLQVALPCEYPENPPIGTKPYLTNSLPPAGSWGTVTAHTDGRFASPWSEEVCLHLSASVPTGVDAFLLYSGASSVFSEGTDTDTTTAGRWGKQLQPSLSEILLCLREIKGPSIRYNEELTGQVFDDPTPVSLQDLQTRHHLAGAYAGPGRNKIAGADVWEGGDSIHLFSMAANKSDIVDVRTVPDCTLAFGTVTPYSITHAAGASPTFTYEDVGRLAEFVTGSAVDGNRIIRCKIMALVDDDTIAIGLDILGGPHYPSAVGAVTLYIKAGTDYGPKGTGAALIAHSGANVTGADVYPGMAPILNIRHYDRTTVPVAHLYRIEPVGGVANVWRDVDISRVSTTTIEFNSITMDLTKSYYELDITKGLGAYCYLSGTPDDDGWYAVAGTPAANQLELFSLARGSNPSPGLSGVYPPGARALLFRPDLVVMDGDTGGSGQVVDPLLPVSHQTRTQSMLTFPGDDIGLRVVQGGVDRTKGGIALLDIDERISIWGHTFTVDATVSACSIVRSDPTDSFSTLIPYVSVIRMEDPAHAENVGDYLLVDVDDDTGTLKLASFYGSNPTFVSSATVLAGHYEVYALLSPSGLLLPAAQALTDPVGPTLESQPAPISIGIPEDSSTNEYLLANFHKRYASEADRSLGLLYWHHRLERDPFSTTEPRGKMVLQLEGEIRAPRTRNYPPENAHYSISAAGTPHWLMSGALDGAMTHNIAAGFNDGEFWQMLDLPEGERLQKVEICFQLDTPITFPACTITAYVGRKALWGTAYGAHPTNYIWGSPGTGLYTSFYRSQLYGAVTHETMLLETLTGLTYWGPTIIPTAIAATGTANVWRISTLLSSQWKNGVFPNIDYLEVSGLTSGGVPVSAWRDGEYLIKGIDSAGGTWVDVYNAGGAAVVALDGGSISVPARGRAGAAVTTYVDVDTTDITFSYFGLTMTTRTR